MSMMGIKRIFRISLLRPRDIDREVDDEIAFHLSMREAKLRAGGIPDGDAARIARDRSGTSRAFAASVSRKVASLRVRNMLASY